MLESRSLELVNPVLARVMADEIALGMVIRLARSGEIARIAKSSGFDFLFIDTQHALFSLETIGHITQAALGCSVAAFVRARSCRDPDIPRLLDNGAGGIIVPDVNTAEEARLAAEACKFAPIGRRPLVGSYPFFDYRPVEQSRAVSLLNANTLLVCMIEAQQGVANAQAIAAVAGVDALLIGLNDLLADMGRPGAYGDPEAMQAIGQVIAGARAHGKIAGVAGENSLERQAIFIRQGARLMPTQSDVAFLMAGASRAAGDLRGIHL